MKEYLLVINEKENILGEEEKEKCHLGQGILHLAFLVMVFNQQGENNACKEE